MISDHRLGTDIPEDDEIVSIDSDQLKAMSHGQMLDFGRSLGLNMDSCDTVGKALTRIVGNAYKIRSTYD